MASQVVKYQVDDSTVVGFEFEPGSGFHQAGAKEFVGQVRKAVEPAVEAAKAVLEKVKEMASTGELDVDARDLEEINRAGSEQASRFGQQVIESRDWP